MSITIVIAWPERTGLEDTGELHRPDGVNWQKRFRVVAEGHAAVWLWNGTEPDVENARKHARTIDGAEVFTYPATEKDPKGAAKAAILKRSAR